MLLWILGLSAAYAVALNGTMVMPVVVLSISKLAGYDEGMATLVASAELAGIALYGLFLPKLALKSWKAVAIGGLVAVVAGEAVSFTLHAPLLLAGARFATGLGEGAVFSLVAMSLASRANAERLWGALCLVGGSAMGVLLFVVSLMPQPEADAPVFLMLAAFAAVMAPLLLFVTRRSPSLTVATHHSRLDRSKMLLAMVVVFLVYAVQAAQWAVCGYVGERVGLSNGEVGFYLAVSSLAGFAGAVIPSFTRDKAKRLPAVLAGFLIMAASIYFLFNRLTPPVFVAAQVFVNMGFYAVTPFVTGILTENDPDGSLMSRTLVVAIVGATVGTALAGPVFAAAGASAFAWGCLLPLAIAAICGVMIFGHLHRILPAIEAVKTAE
ncbi:MFS transporter [Phyllobacterium leguminum]|uniref:Putative MFS family arabinose efflux permease n=1 Tax=Phyllobacterium leguminum TaxID=314237 RepID=A0A318SYN4_9HYPH|nr:MFS transporter [Phyllobacterium leguminum]PYE86578.1 putative MFS family arabinose efflux permease [Phyllobacterium leguminum]